MSSPPRLGVLIIFLFLGLFCAAKNTTGFGSLKEESNGHQSVLQSRQLPVDQMQTLSDQAEMAHDTISIKNVVQQVLSAPNINLTSNDPNGFTWAQQQYGQIVDDNDEVLQVPWYNNGSFPFNPPASVPYVQDPTTGELYWTKLPGALTCSVDGHFVPKGNNTFVLNSQDLVPTNETMPDGRPIVQPYYVTSPDLYEPINVKRAIIVFPGKPRDSWRYANLVYNTLAYAISQPDTYHINPGEVIILSPAVLNEDDKNTGGAEDNWVVYQRSNWEMGGISHAPPMNSSVTFYSVLDKMIGQLNNRTLYPNLNQVVVAGHSLGGQASLRYGMTRKQRHYDSNVRFWVGNPGSYTWLTTGIETKPNPSPITQNQEDCSGTVDKWPYGFGNRSALTKYARTRIFEDVPAAINLFRWRTVHYAFGLLDNGGGDTHCEAQYQGYNHLQRGSNFVMSLANMPEGWPTNHSLSYVAGVSHQDYEMLAATQSMNYILVSDYNLRNPDLWIPAGTAAGTLSTAPPQSPVPQSELPPTPMSLPTPPPAITSPPPPLAPTSPSGTPISAEPS